MKHTTAYKHKLTEKRAHKRSAKQSRKAEQRRAYHKEVPRHLRNPEGHSRRGR